jgi:hypothetical protein
VDNRNPLPSKLPLPFFFLSLFSLFLFRTLFYKKLRLDGKFWLFVLRARILAIARTIGFVTASDVADVQVIGVIVSSVVGFVTTSDVSNVRRFVIWVIHFFPFAVFAVCLSAMPV